MKKSGTRKVLTKDLQIEDEVKEDSLFVAGYIKKGEDKGKFVAIKVKNTVNLNPVEPILDRYPEIEVLVVGKNEKKVKQAFKKLL